MKYQSTSKNKNITNDHTKSNECRKYLADHLTDVQIQHWSVKETKTLDLEKQWREKHIALSMKRMKNIDCLIPIAWYA